MKSVWILSVLALLAGSLSTSASAQSLAEVARREAARRQTVTTGKVITNDDLKPVPPAPVPPAPAATTGDAGKPTTPAAGTESKGGATPAADAKTPAPDGKTPAADEKKDEAYWRKRMATTRENLARSETFRDALQSRIDALWMDFVNRDNPVQRTQIEIDRQKALAELERVKKEITQHQTELTTIADEARRAGVPAGWVR